MDHATNRTPVPNEGRQLSPHTSRTKLTGSIVKGVSAEEHGKSNAGGYYADASHEKHNRELNFSRSTSVEFPDNGQRQAKHDEISDDVLDTHTPEESNVEACARDTRVPLSRDGIALWLYVSYVSFGNLIRTYLEDGREHRADYGSLKSINMRCLNRVAPNTYPHNKHYNIGNPPNISLRK